MSKYTKGDRVRVRRQGTNDKWCICRVELVSPNGLSLGLTVEDGAVHAESGGMITGFLPISLMRNEAVEIATETRLEMESITHEG